MSNTSAPWPSGHPDDLLATDSTARVVTVETGVVQVRSRGRIERASYGGALLAAVAQDPGAAPRVGDRVLLRRWGDGRSTVERVVARGMP